MDVSENSRISLQNDPFFLNLVFHYFHHPFWGVSLFLETPIYRLLHHIIPPTSLPQFFTDQGVESVTAAQLGTIQVPASRTHPNGRSSFQRFGGSTDIWSKNVDLDFRYHLYIHIFIVHIFYSYGIRHTA